MKYLAAAFMLILMFLGVLGITTMHFYMYKIFFNESTSLLLLLPTAFFYLLTIVIAEIF